MRTEIALNSGHGGFKASIAIGRAGRLFERMSVKVVPWVPKLSFLALGQRSISTVLNSVASAEMRPGLNKAAALPGRSTEHSFQDIAAGAYGQGVVE